MSDTSWFDIAAGAGGALLAAALGYGAAILESRRERAMRRGAIATALLVELRWQERIFRMLAKHEEAAVSTMPLLYQTLDQFTGKLELEGGQVVPDVRFRLEKDGTVELPSPAFPDSS